MGLQVPSAPNRSVSLCNAPSSTGGHVIAAGAALPSGTRSAAGPRRRPGQGKAKVAPAALAQGRPAEAAASPCAPAERLPGIAAVSERSAGPGRQGRADSQRGQPPRCSQPGHEHCPWQGQVLLRGTFTEGQRLTALPVQREVGEGKLQKQRARG